MLLLLLQVHALISFRGHIFDPGHLFRPPPDMPPDTRVSPARTDMSGHLSVALRMIAVLWDSSPRNVPAYCGPVASSLRVQLAGHVMT